MHLGDTHGTHIPFYISCGATFYAFETTSALQCDISVPSRPLTPPKNPAFRSRGSSFLRISRFYVHTPFRLLFLALSIDFGALWAAPRKVLEPLFRSKMPSRLPNGAPKAPKTIPQTTPNCSQKLPRTLRGSSWSRSSYLTAFRAAKWYPRNSQNDPQTTPNPPPKPPRPHIAALECLFIR